MDFSVFSWRPAPTQLFGTRVTALCASILQRRRNLSWVKKVNSSIECQGIAQLLTCSSVTERRTPSRPCSTSGHTRPWPMSWLGLKTIEWILNTWITCQKKWKRLWSRVRMTTFTGESCIWTSVSSLAKSRASSTNFWLQRRAPPNSTQSRTCSVS